jgi:hypothetical protein
MTATRSTAGSTAELPGDPGTLLFENDRIRVWELIMQPGEVCNWHVHAYDHLLVVIDGARIEARKSDGRAGVRDIEDNTVLFIPASPVAEIARNSSPNRTLRELIIDLKDPTAQVSAAAFIDFFRPGTATTSRAGTLDAPGSI